MGAGGALALALRVPGVFSAAYASGPMIDRTADTGGWQWSLRGLRSSTGSNLPVISEGTGSWANHLAARNGAGVLTWPNHQEALMTRQSDVMVL